VTYVHKLTIQEQNLLLCRFIVAFDYAYRCDFVPLKLNIPASLSVYFIEKTAARCTPEKAVHCSMPFGWLA
jgi:hypothetical protein